MSKTRECMELKVKVTRWQVIGKIALALIAAYAASVATHTATTTASKDTVETDARQMDTVIIPLIQKTLDKLEAKDKKEHAYAEATRERLVRLETILERMPGRWGDVARLKPASDWGLSKILGKAKKSVKKVEKKKSLRIPTLRRQHQQMGPSLEGVIKGDD